VTQANAKDQIKSLYSLLKAKDMEISKLKRNETIYQKKIQKLDAQCKDLVEKLKMTKKPGKINIKEPNDSEL
tara:strand:+ start:2136 stop:2351 length:216 start_codon:yes stop_codon:yes gene_type:complete